MTRVRAISLGVLAILLIACGTSNVDDNAEVSVSGKLLLPGGAPASGVAVGLMLEPDPLSVLVDMTVTIGSVGIACLTKTVSICKGSRKVTTDANGQYAFTMKGKDSKNFFGNPAKFVVSSQINSGAQVQTRFNIGSATMALPDVTFWEPSGLTAKPSTDSVTYSFADFQPKPNGYRVMLTRADETIWSQDGPASGRIDARALADATADFHAVATTDRNGFATEHHSPRISVHGSAGTPTSRGAACAVSGADGPVPANPCVLTDGRYAPSFAPQACPNASPSPKPCTANGFVQVDLGSSRPAHAVFAHGLWQTTDVIIQSSMDGHTWTDAARVKPLAYLNIPLPAGTSARYFRLASADQTQPIHALTELATW